MDLLFSLSSFELSVTVLTTPWILGIASFGEVLLCLNREDKFLVAFGAH